MGHDMRYSLLSDYNGGACVCHMLLPESLFYIICYKWTNPTHPQAWAMSFPLNVFAEVKALNWSI